ncbi:MAG TPA: phospholipase D-like domain-containing protein, partial [Longimicrobiales bacterium]|nr:phospholipase D-like domain-containing protein [Longimicrobiales bacterium]
MRDPSGLVSTSSGEAGPPVVREGVDALPERAMERATGGRRIDGNALRLQFEGSSTFEAWLDAIDGARRFVHFENYILRDDRVGRAFRDALVAKAREGVPVRVLFDWVGSWATPRRYWKPFREAGVEVRAFNRPSVRDPLGVFQRDHRKLVCVDADVAFVGGFCVGVEWAGRGSDPPWRDTGVEVRGPAAVTATQAFERIWSEIGDPVPEALRADPARCEVAGSTPVWVIEGEPWRSRVYRTLSLVAAHARETLWITDPYFVAPRPVTEALAAAARDGVDVRILLPGHNNWPWVGSLSRGGYRPLLEAGVRLFEWLGPMIHAKTAVADGLWCRVGSSNLNTASLLGNWEIDIGVLEEDLAGQLEGLFLADLMSAIEIVLPRRHVALERARAGGAQVDRGAAGGEAEPPKHPLEPEGTLPERLERQIRAQVGKTRYGGSGSTGWRLADLVRAGTAFGDALAGHRPLGREDRTVLGTVAGGVMVLAVLSAIFPRAVGWTFAVVLGWLGLVVGT